jgi:hypothetical protein
VEQPDQPELAIRPAWRRTGNAFFPTAARVDGQWWVLRINSFPDHPLWTLFVDGKRRFDVDDAPAAWGEPSRLAVLLETSEATDALAPVLRFEAYGSETGQPCENPFCCG